ncbi:MAG: hypothetical protein Q4F07_08010 [Bacteroidales bacterium]|nr:hypothetical protein [Bacteroidales bacterium]
MKKVVIVLSVLFSAGCFFNESINAMPAQSPICASQDYCPTDKVCIATNLKSWQEGKGIAGPDVIAIYKTSDGSLVAKVKGHGNLYLFKQNGNWHFRANSKVYVIEGFSYDN